MTTIESDHRVGPLSSDLDAATVIARAATEYERLADALAALSPDQWAAPTCCPGWDVRALAGHCLGMTTMTTSKREMVRQQIAAGRAAKRSGAPMVDELTALQVRENADASPAALVDSLRTAGPRAARGRRRGPGIMRRATVTQVTGGRPEKWRMSYLLDVILTRDPWMHRSDIAAATGVPMRLSAEHDGAIVTDVVAEWARRHGRSYDLTLTGPAGGHWRDGAGGEALTLDAIEFCRIVSGRGVGRGLLATAVPF
ncbi:MAG TPA: maleylpyruvate isomerase family mycothiol-dependent enzyme [Aldersonia sp.]